MGSRQRFSFRPEHPTAVFIVGGGAVLLPATAPAPQSLAWSHRSAERLWPSWCWCWYWRTCPCSGSFLFGAFRETRRANVQICPPKRDEKAILHPEQPEIQ